MKKFFQNLQALWSLGLLVSGTNYKSSMFVDTVIGYLLEGEWLNVDINNTWCTITTKKHKVRFWNVNKYYAWICVGKCIDRKSGKTIITWTNEMPSPYQMLQLRDKVKNYLKSTLAKSY